MALPVTPGQLKRTAEFYRQLASLMAAGIRAVEALQSIRKHPPSRRFVAPVAYAIEAIQAGASFTEALAGPRQWLAPFDLALLRAGETSGRLVESFRALADHYQARARLIDGFILKLLYPVFLLHLAALIFPTELIPMLVLEGRVGAFLAQKALVLLPLYALAAGLIIAAQSHHLNRWRAWIETLLQPVPMLGAARRELALARLASALEALISAGVGIIEAWELAATASGSARLERAVRSWLPAVLGGALPSEQLRNSPPFPEMFSNLYFSGELSGQLDQELRHLHQFYEESGLRKLNASVLGAALLLSLGVMLAIAWFVIRFWINYFNQISNAGGF